MHQDIKKRIKWLVISYLSMVVFFLGTLLLAGMKLSEMPIAVWIILFGFAVLFAISGFIGIRYKDYIKSHKRIIGVIIITCGIISSILYIVADILEKGFEIRLFINQMIPTGAFLVIGYLMLTHGKKNKKP